MRTTRRRGDGGLDEERVAELHDREHDHDQHRHDERELDSRRAAFTAADRKAQYDAAMDVRALFGELSDLVYKINAVRSQADATAAKLGEGDATRKQLAALSASADAIRKKIVATKEGGAITGEERLREHTDTLYGSIMAYDGRPTDYQLARTAALKKEFGDVNRQFADFQSGDLVKANAKLRDAKLPEIQVPAAQPEEAESSSAAGERNEAHAPWERD